MNERQMGLVRELLRCGDYQTIASLARALRCSERTVHYDISSINEELGRRGLASVIQGQRGLGVRLSLGEEELAYVEELAQGGTAKDHADVDLFMRCFLILLTGKTDRVKIEVLARMLYVTQSRLRSDIRRWSQLLEFFHCGIETKGSVFLTGDEFAVRLAAIHLLHAFAPVTMRTEAKDFFRHDAPLIERIVQDLEHCQDAPFSDIAQAGAYFATGVALSRIRQGHQVELPETGEEPDPAMEKIRRSMTLSTGVAVRPDEMAFLLRVASCSTRRYDRRASDAEEASERGRRFARVLVGSAGLGDELSSSFEDALAMIVDQGMRRSALSSPIVYRQPFSLKVSRMASYARSIRKIWEACEAEDVALFNADKDKIALLMLAMEESGVEEQLCRAALVANCGMEQVSYAIARLRRLLPSLVVESVMPSEIEAADSPFDFAIVFEHMAAGVPVCQVSFAVDENDVSKIGSFVLKVRNRFEHSPASVRLSCLTTQLFATSLVGLGEAIGRKACAEGLFEGDMARFARAFNDTCVLFGDMGVAVMPVAGVCETAGRLYLTSPYFIGRTINRFAVLFVREEDMGQIDGIALQFRERMNIPASIDVSWELPPLLAL